MHYARARLRSLLIMRPNHLVHPAGFAGQIDIICAQFGTRRHNIATIKLIGTHRRANNLAASDHVAHALRVARISHHQRCLGRRPNLVAHGGEFFGAAAGHRPIERSAILIFHIFGNQTARKPRRTIYNYVEFGLFPHHVLLKKLA